MKARFLPSTTLHPSPLFFFLFLAAGLVPAFAQTAEKLDAVLEARQVSYAQAAGIILPAAGLLSPEAGGGEAFARARDWLPGRAEPDAPITMGEVSHLAMQSFGLSGGFMYGIFPGPRYAYRALAWRRFLPPKADPARTLSGEELLYITGRLLSYAGEEELLPAAAAPAPEPAGEEPPDTRLNVEQGQGLSTGPEELLPYTGEFEVE